MKNNPYPGLASFSSELESQSYFYGREREISGLFNMVMSERITLLHSPSGAGKTSLIQAGLIPRFKENVDDQTAKETKNNLQVLPVLRVNEDLLALKKFFEMKDKDFKESDYNRFSWSVLRSLETVRPEEDRLPLNRLARMTIAEYLNRADWIRTGAPMKFMIFDQFEEVLTIDEYDVKAKKDFFKELGITLRDRRIWTLFVVRDDYVAALDPYEVYLPTFLRNRFRLELLDQKGAREAITEPAKELGVTYDAAAVEKLVDLLRSYDGYDIEGERGTYKGEWIYPLYLQIICYILWGRLKEGAKKITKGDIEKLNSVMLLSKPTKPEDAALEDSDDDNLMEEEIVDDNIDRALAYYYATGLKSICPNKNEEEKLRDWIGKTMISFHGQRRQVKCVGEDELKWIKDIEKLHLLRPAKREGVYWLELYHDRLVRPIQNNNVRWLHENQHMVQRRAAEWYAGNKQDELLLAKHEIPAAKKWMKNRRDLELKVRRRERAYISESDAHQKKLSKKRHYFIFKCVSFAVGLLIIVIGFKYYYNYTVVLLSNMDNEVKELRESRELLENKAKLLSITFDEAKKKLEKRELDFRARLAKLDEKAKEELEKRELVINFLRIALETSEKAYYDQGTDIKGLLDEKEAFLKENNEYKNQIATLNNKRQELESSLDALNKKKSELEKKLKESENKIDKLKKISKK